MSKTKQHAYGIILTVCKWKESGNFTWFCMQLFKSSMVGSRSPCCLDCWKTIKSWWTPVEELSNQQVLCFDFQVCAIHFESILALWWPGKKVLAIKVNLMIFIVSQLERGQNSENPAVWLVPGVGRIFSSRPLQQAESVKLIYFHERISSYRQSFTLFTLPWQLINTYICLSLYTFMS